MKKIFGLWLVILTLGLLSQSLLALEKKQSSLGIISDAPKNQFEAQLPLILGSISRTNSYDAKNYTPYLDNGDFDEAGLLSAMQNAVRENPIVYIGWNRKMNLNYQPIVDFMNKAIADGVVVIAASGTARDIDQVVSLRKTVVGQMSDIVIIGELKERETLLRQSFYGPEMLTAITPPREYLGQGYAALIFAAKFAENYPQKTPTQWKQHFLRVKTETRRIFPLMDDFFKR